jgi:hypothetical protein
MIATADTTERVIETRYSYFNDRCIHIMRWDFDGETYYYAVDSDLTSIGPTRLCKAMALLDGRRVLGRFRPTCACRSDDDECHSVAVRRWRRFRAAHPIRP